MNIGENIKRIRTEKNMTQKELGEKLGGISQQQIGRWENGNKSPKFDTIRKIASALNVDISDIIGDYYQIGMERHRNLGPILSKATIKTDKMDEIFLINYYRQLNDTGKAEAHKRVGELTLLDIYKTAEKQQSVILKYNPDIATDISGFKTLYNELGQQEKDTSNDENFDSPEE